MSAEAWARLRQRVGPWIGRWLGPLFGLLVIVLLLKLAHGIDWRAAGGALQRLPATTLMLALGLAACSHALYASYDLIGRHVTAHGLPKRQVLAVGFMAYAFNVNLGWIVGGMALRYKLYAARGLAASTVTQVLALSVVSNWLGYLAVAGVVLLIVPLPLPQGWMPGLVAAGPGLGALLLAVVVVYVGLCMRLGPGRRRHDEAQPTAGRPGWRRWRETLPSPRVAAVQLLLASVNWLLIAATVYVLLGRRVDYPLVLVVLLLAAVAGVLAHVPAGMGVLEAVFLACLGPRLPQAEILAALIAYRAVYYLVPLALASGLMLATRHQRAPSPPRPQRA